LGPNELGHDDAGDHAVYSALFDIGYFMEHQISINTSRYNFKFINSIITSLNTPMYSTSILLFPATDQSSILLFPGVDQFTVYQFYYFPQLTNVLFPAIDQFTIHQFYYFPE
jgi:hypothetical protein